MTINQLKNEVVKRSFKVKRFSNKYVIVGCMAIMYSSRWSIKCNCGYKNEVELERFYVEPLKSALKLLGRLGHMPNKDSNYLGNCAEQRACNYVLFKDTHHPLALNQVEYTPAYRVRTAQIKKYCPNCVTSLGVKNKQSWN